MPKSRSKISEDSRAAQKPMAVFGRAFDLDDIGRSLPSVIIHSSTHSYCFITDSYQELDSEPEICLQKVYYIASLGTTILREWGKKNWVEGEVKLWCGFNRDFSQPHGEFWSWDESSEVSWLKVHRQASVLWHWIVIGCVLTPRAVLTLSVRFPSLQGNFREENASGSQENETWVWHTTHSFAIMFFFFLHITIHIK